MASISISTVAMVASAASAAIGAMGAIAQGQAAASAADYNAKIAAQNASVDRQKAVWAGEAGEQQANAQEMKTRATVGAIKTAQAAGNIDVNSGSAVDVRSSAASLGELDAINIRSNATRIAYGYNVEATGAQNQSTLDTFASKNDALAGYMGGATTFLGGVGSGTSNWLKYNQPNLMTPPAGIQTSQGNTNPYTY